MADPKRSEILFEHTWRRNYSDFEAGTVVRDFRIVGSWWPGDDGKVGALYCEELYEDAMGQAGWHRVEDADRFMVPFARLLQMCGRIPESDDLSELP